MYTHAYTQTAVLQLAVQALQQLQEAWQQVQAAPVEAAGTPHVWLDFKAPFADPPPVFVSKKPEPGPEPQLVLPTDLQEPPVYQPPAPQVSRTCYAKQLLPWLWLPADYAVLCRECLQSL